MNILYTAMCILLLLKMWIQRKWYATSYVLGHSLFNYFVAPNYPYPPPHRSAGGIGNASEEKLSTMVDNSASCPFNSCP